MQKHFSAGSGTYYSDSIFFLSVAMHRIMPKGKAQLSCKHSLYMCAMWNAKLTDFHGKRLRHQGMVGGFCATQQAGAALTPQDVKRRQDWSWPGHMQPCICHVCFYNLPSPWCVSRKRCHVLQHSEGAACSPVSAVRLLSAPSLPVALMSSWEALLVNSH